MIATLGALLLLAGACAAFGALARGALSLPRGPGEDVLTFTAGLGTTTLLLSLLALAGVFGASPALLGCAALAGVLLFARRISRSRERAGASPPAPRAGLSARLATSVAAVVVVLAALSAVAPVTDPDSLAYPLPLARRIAESGAWRFWPDLWRGVFPLSQEMLVAFALRLHADRLGAISALELVLCALLLHALARRAGADAFGRGAAVLVGLGCPLVAYLAPSAKEDLLACAMTLAAGHALLSLETPGAAAAAGLFAGFAAGAKYSGLPIAAGTVLAVLLCAPRARLRLAAVAAATALAAGGLFYAVNAVRHGNPLPPYLSPPLPSFLTPLSRHQALEAFRWGEGRGPVDAVLAPVRMLASPARFGTAGGLFNPLAWLGVLALFDRELRRRYGPFLVVAAVVYLSWFATNQVARLLLPAALLMSVPAGEILARVAGGSRAPRVPVAAALALSAASVLVVSGVRLMRWAASPRAFTARETSAAEELAWMGSHLNPARDRVATMLKACDALRIPWLNLDPSYQAEIPAELLGTGPPLLAALRTHGITHVFVPVGSLPALEPLLTPVHESPASLLGGVHLFRENPTVATTVYAVPGDNAGRESRGR